MHLVHTSPCMHTTTELTSRREFNMHIGFGFEDTGRSEPTGVSGFEVTGSLDRCITITRLIVDPNLTFYFDLQVHIYR